MRFALGLEYDGRAFCGFQSQPSGCGVQDALERALVVDRASARSASSPAGRTDAGVHATLADRALRHRRAAPADARGCAASTRTCPRGAAVLWAHAGRATISTRASRRARATTRYLLLARAERPGLDAGRVGWYHRPLDVDAMQRAADRARRRARFLVVPRGRVPGEVAGQDACASRACAPPATLVRFDFSANAFLHHMIRNLVGALVYVGAGKHDAGVDRRRCSRRATARAAPPTFAADGLYFTGADYDARFGLPPTTRRDVAAAPTLMRDAHQDLRHHARRRRRSPPRVPAPTRSASCSGRARRASSQLAQARAIAGALPPFVTIVGLFVDPTADEVHAVARRGAARPAAVPRPRAAGASAARSAGPTSRRSPSTRRVDLLESRAPYDDAAGLLFDAPPSRGVPGGTGRTFDWSRLPATLPRPLVLSGGLNAANVGDARSALVRPWAVDVSSGVEASGAGRHGRSQGIKDAAKIAAFIEEVRHADV